jgi:hypothetical protein
MMVELGLPHPVYGTELKKLSWRDSSNIRMIGQINFLTNIFLL